MDLKQLKKIIDLCRKSGIKTFKGDGFEFELSDSIPAKKHSKKAKKEESVQSTLPSDFNDPTADELMFWSATQMPQELETAKAE